MRKPLVVVCTTLLAFLPATEPAFADSDEILKELRALKSRIQQLEQKLAEQDKKIEKQNAKLDEQETRIVSQTSILDEVKKIQDAIGGLEFSVGATSVVQGTINNDRNHRRVPGIDEKGDDADATWSVDIEITSKVGENGMALLYLEGGEGDGVNTEAGGLTGANADATDDDADLQVSEIWYEHSFMKGTLLATIGKIDITRWFDANAVANDETSQFLSGMFVNSVAVEFPYYSYGMRLGYYPREWLELGIGYAESDSDFEDLFDDNFYIVEVGFKPVFGERQGNYRFYGWHNSGEHEKLRRPYRRDESGDGFGLSFDQQLSEHVTAFLRWGIADDDVYAVHRSWSTGFQVAGGLWGRDDDMFGLALGRAETGHAYRDTLRDDGWGTTPAETRIEAYYSYKVNEHVTISPDFQWVDGLSGASNADPVTILGVRAQLDF